MRRIEGMQTLRDRGLRRAGLLGLALAGMCACAPAGASAAGARPAPPALPGSVAGKVFLAPDHVGGNPPFAFVRQRIAMRGVVWPYVGGQAVKVSIYFEARKVAVERLAVKPVGNGSGRFRVTFTSGSPGLVRMRVVHYATPLQAQFSAQAPNVRYVQANLGPGASGPSVQLLQSELNRLHYAVPLSGVL